MHVHRSPRKTKERSRGLGEAVGTPFTFGGSCGRPSCCNATFPTGSSLSSPLAAFSPTDTMALKVQAFFKGGASKAVKKAAPAKKSSAKVRRCGESRA
jgi:hypothetical protein